ncbi:hypothetical protein [Mycoplasma struthionis]|uniref:hypothetical protein n=1 Tax=Mycoplasma struthionis TaxID=538220 RepID=UPI001FE93F8F|nr:hypothetical protein [Mycoplasma struthionis]
MNSSFKLFLLFSKETTLPFLIANIWLKLSANKFKSWILTKTVVLNSLFIFLKDL